MDNIQVPDQDVQAAYASVAGLIIDMLFSLNRTLSNDTQALILDPALTEDDKTFVKDIQAGRRDAIANLCAHLSTVESQLSLPTIASRHWVLGEMRRVEGQDEQLYLWHGYKFLERSLLMFEERFGERLGM